MALNIPFDADLAAVETDLPQTVTISGTPYTCVADVLRKGESLMMEGVMGDADLLIVMRVSTLSAPAIGSKLTYSGTQYRVERVAHSPCGTSYNLECVDSNK